ncbi:MAG TPA: Tim44/TimA family putative adaptor protein [Rhizomicrobium sp.]|nr:Tim44/TimA family putative adaptor protein [Rhizomicrobium sp.]
MANSQLLVIVAVAMVAGIILFRLYTVLGRRTGNEREPRQRFSRIGGTQEDGNNVVALPGLRSDGLPAKPIDETQQALLDIKLADRHFDTDHFVVGAKKAHELIVTAYAKGDREALRPLLNDEVFAAFDGAIRDRENRKEAVRFTLVGYKDAKITHASLKNRIAEITLTFAVQFISSTVNADGAVIEGDPAAVRDVTDIWTFSRDTRSSDPNWALVATSGGEF